MLLIAEKRLKNVKILAITCVDGNTTMENVVKNTYRILWGLNRTDVNKYCSSVIDKIEYLYYYFTSTQVPIHQGAVEPLLNIDKKRTTFHGVNGMGDVQFWDPSFPKLSEIIHPINAIQIIRDLVMKVSRFVFL